MNRSAVRASLRRSYVTARPVRVGPLETPKGTPDPGGPDQNRARGVVLRVAQAGMPSAAAHLAERHSVRFNRETLKRYRHAGGPLATFACLLIGTPGPAQTPPRGRAR